MAMVAYGCGLLPQPVRNDGSKAPAVPEWPTTFPARETVSGWFAPGKNIEGLGLVSGAISRDLEVLEFDDVPTIDRFRAAATRAGLSELLAHVDEGYAERTPGGGLHWLFTTERARANRKLARRPCPDPASCTKHAAEFAAHGERRRYVHVLIETRGEGGFIVIAPSGGPTHETGRPYELVSGGLESIATLTVEERDALYELARTFDEMPIPEPRERSTRPADGTRPGDQWAAVTSWAAILEPAGFRLDYRSNDEEFWTRPGKAHGVSATSNFRGSDLLYVFSSSISDLEPESTYTKFGAFTALFHGGNFASATRALADAGFGEQRASPLPNVTDHGHGGPGGTSTLTGTHGGWPEPPGPAAFAGLVGEIVHEASSISEADPVAVLANLLLAFGAAMGSGPHAMVGGTRHPARENILVVGNSSKARKGDARGVAELFLITGMPDFRANIHSGLSTGEGLLHAVRDPIEGTQVDRKTGDLMRVMLDEGVDDKRMLIHEPEFARVLRAMSRQGNTLSAVIRDAWDGRERLEVMTRTKPIVATGAHMAVGGDITIEELRRELNDTELANGTANRFLVFLVRRARELADPPELDVAVRNRLAHRLAGRVEAASRVGLMRRDADAAELWQAVYGDLSKEQPGLFGSIIARAEAHVLRLSLIYALLDGSTVVTRAHLASAIEVWAYCERSAEYIFGATLGYPEADIILAALRLHPLDRSAINRLFHGHTQSAVITSALSYLRERGLADFASEQTNGRPAETWRAL